jgi:hypothetical protein
LKIQITVKTEEVFIPFSENTLFGDTIMVIFLEDVYMIVSDDVTR